MTGAVSWMLVAAALLSWPGGRRASARHQAAVDRRDVDGVGSGRLPAGVLHAAAAVSTAVVAVGTLGVTAGLTVTVVAVPGVVVLVARLAARPRARGPDLRLPLTLDLAAAAMRAGRPVDQALVLAAPTASGSVGRRLVQVAGLLRLGADPAEAWRVVAADDALAPVARTATRSASSGARLASALEDVAAELREQAGAEARARAQRAGTWAMLPLGLCFLPAFVCLGVVPVVVGIARGAMAGGP